jgi:hypothetical protein
MPAATLALLLTTALPTRAANFPVNYSPTGIACDAISNLVSVSSSSGINIYATNGNFVGGFASSAFDLGAGTGGNVWIANGTSSQKRDYQGNGMASTSLPGSTVALGRELSVGGTNYLLYAVSGGNVVAKNPDDGSTTVLFATPANVTGGDWTLRPGGYALEHVLVGLNTISRIWTYAVAWT